MNVLHLSATKNWGGGENHIENLCFELKCSSPDVKNIIFCARNGKFQKRLIQQNIEVVEASLSFKMDPRYILKLITFCKNQHIDLIHIHDTIALTLGVVADYLYELPPFILSKKTSFPIKSRKQTIHKYNYQKIRKVLCVSEETKRVASNSIKNHHNLVTIFHGTKIEHRNTVVPFQIREKFNLKAKTKIIGSIANHIRAKNLETLIEVADYIINKQKRTDFFFAQMGSFTERTPALQQKVKELNLEEHFAFLDFVPEASNVIPQFDISVVSSQSEGIPGFIYESFYYRTPVISTNVGGIPEVIENGGNGFLADKYDYKKLAGYVLQLSENPDLVKQFTECSYQKVVNNFTTKIMAEKTLSEYKKVIDGKS